MPSSVIRTFDYHPSSHELDVTFTSGRIYRYFGVPETLADKFSRAISKGRFFNLRIRNRFDFEEVATVH